jgi:hypothetical protein
LARAERLGIRSIRLEAPALTRICGVGSLFFGQPAALPASAEAATTAKARFGKNFEALEGGVLFGIARGF